MRCSQDSDIVSLHLPNNTSTRKMFTAEKFAEMPEGSVFINCARGAIVDNDALADALNSGHLAGAGIDVFDMEPPLPEELQAHPRKERRADAACGLPHRGGHAAPCCHRVPAMSMPGLMESRKMSASSRTGHLSAGSGGCRSIWQPSSMVWHL
jgi:phosphoglycerate dehydrogenase-like enzyme